MVRIIKTKSNRFAHKEPRSFSFAKRAGRLKRRKKFDLSDDLNKKARLLGLAGDPTRIRILRFMFEYKKACVSDIAESLGMGITCISHHLQLMRDNGFFTTERIGNSICYILQENELTDSLRRIIYK